MKRRAFLQYGLALAGISGAALSCNNKRSVKGSIIGANAGIGHLLRDKTFPTPIKSGKKKVVIIGGGVSGLSAARHLQKNNITDFILLELDQKVGGNAAYGQNQISSFPLGAHYIPIPNNNLSGYLEFLQEAGVITSFDENNLPVYNEAHLCFDPEERLYLNGRWQEGLIPHFGVPEIEAEQLKRFFQHMQEFRVAIGNDGKEAFNIPVNNSSADPIYTALDQITMKDWLQKNNYNSEYIHWYTNYCTRDDFGTPYDQCSAWAGIHYFAARKGKGSNAGYSDVLTWPEGNGFLIKHLESSVKDNIQTGCLATQVVSSEKAILINYFDTKDQQLKQWEAESCILAVPQFVAARLLQNKVREDSIHQDVQYVPWMVANLLVNSLDEKSGVTLSWDNVIHESKSLGYVNATQQLLDGHLTKRNLTYYLPLTDKEVREERKSIEKRTHPEWVEIIMKDLERVHPDIREKTEEVTIQIWGHAMAQTKPGWIFGNLRKSLSEPINKSIYFAHTDIAGISIFEEGFYQGIQAAGNILKA